MLLDGGKIPLLKELLVVREVRGELRGEEKRARRAKLAFYIQNGEAWLAQRAGEEVRVPCGECTLGRSGLGRGEPCVALSGFLLESCAGCHYGKQGARCSLRPPPVPKGSKKRTASPHPAAPAKRAAVKGQEKKRKKGNGPEEVDTDVSESRVWSRPGRKTGSLYGPGPSEVNKRPLPEGFRVSKDGLGIIAGRMIAEHGPQSGKTLKKLGEEIAKMKYQLTVLEMLQQFEYEEYRQ